MPAVRTERLSGWGLVSVELCTVYRPEKRASVAAILACEDEPHYIAQGLGRGYGDAALNAGAGVISQLRLSRFLEFDPEREVVTCEEGVSLGEIVDTFLPRGDPRPDRPAWRGP